MDAMLNAEVENAMQCLLESYELAAVYGDEEMQDTSVYLEFMESLCKIKNDATRSEQALQLAREQNTIEKFMCSYNAEIQKNAKNFHAKKTGEYKTFQTRLSQIMDAAGVQQTQSNAAANTSRVECDEFVMESEINIFDPLTKLRMQDPVRNTLCGHHYEKSTILESIKINPRLRCPVAGCGNNQFIQAKNLLPDNVLKVRLMQMAEIESQDPLTDEI